MTPFDRRTVRLVQQLDDARQRLPQKGKRARLHYLCCGSPWRESWESTEAVCWLCYPREKERRPATTWFSGIRPSEWVDQRLPRVETRHNCGTKACRSCGAGRYQWDSHPFCIACRSRAIASARRYLDKCANEREREFNWLRKARRTQSALKRLLAQPSRLAALRLRRAASAPARISPT